MGIMLQIILGTLIIIIGFLAATVYLALDNTSKYLIIGNYGRRKSFLERLVDSLRSLYDR